ncbi:MAG: ABC transporter permease subunit [Candidatus Thermoplasmatota archaeon]|nr:ABC transporter permease subunit [Candidatus Thermoplasmatota archaeon]
MSESDKIQRKEDSTPLEGDTAEAKQPELQELAVESQKVLRKILRSFRTTWKYYRDSKTGMIGLGIVIAFFIMAIFAPWLSPYDVDFKAPSQDIFIADSEMVNLGDLKNWSPPMGLLAPTKESNMERILLYSDDGVARTYPVDEAQGIVLREPANNTIPANVSYLDYAHFSYSFFFIVEGNLVHEYTWNLIDTDVEYVLPFQPKHFSNLWNGYSDILNTERVAFVIAGDHDIWLISKRPPHAPTGQPAATFVRNMTISDATVIGNPQVMDSSFIDNGSLIVVPTDIGIMAYPINLTTGGLGNIVVNVSIGPRLWTSPYNYTDSNNLTVEFEPVVSENMMTFPDPTSITDDFKKTDVIFVATTDGKLVAYDRRSGSVRYAKSLVMPSIRDYEITGLHPSNVGVLVVGTTGDRGFIAGVDPVNGTINQMGTQYTSVASHIDSLPYFVPGSRMFLFSTVDDSIYLANELMQVNATFMAPGGGSATPVAFIGNIYISSAIGGNYFAVVTNDNHLFTESLQGRNVAPLPPGTYASGNRYILGTDYEGHDILTWLIYGTRAELMVGVTAAFFAVVIGTIVGLVAGFYSGLIDDILMRTTDVVLSLPGLVIILLFAAVFGPSLINIIIIIAILSWAGIARVIRSVTISLKERAFVDAAIIAGASDSRLIFRHIAPNVLPYTFLYMTFSISGAIVTEAILAFLGFGDVNYVTWGMMLQFLQISGHSLDAPWWLLPPGVAITLLCLAFYLIGRAFDEVVNPRLRKR